MEIEPLQTEINALIQSNQDIIERARTQVGNLAHALKTPLAVITNEAREDKSPLAAKVQEQAQVMRDQIGYYLDRAQMAARAGVIGRVTEVAAGRAVAAAGAGAHLPGQGRRRSWSSARRRSASRARSRIWRRCSAISSTTPANGRPHGPRHAPQRCRARAAPAGQRLVITVEDDGPGLTDEQRQRIGKRGMRLDETKPGSGLGLSIVSDIASPIPGRFSLDASPHGRAAGAPGAAGGLNHIAPHCGTSRPALNRTFARIAADIRPSDRCWQRQSAAVTSVAAAHAPARADGR